MTYNFPDHIKGDTFLAQSFTFTKNSSPIDLTGCSIKMMLKKKTTDSTAVLTFENGSGITITDAVNGVWQIDQQIIDIDACIYHYDVQLTYSDGVVATYLKGKITIIQDITT